MYHGELMMLGLNADKVRLSGYDPAWVDAYNKESVAVRKVLGEVLVDIQHIGSTSVPGLKAKPILDILAGVVSFDRIEEIIAILENSGYTYAHWAGIPGDYTFRKGDITTCLLHVVAYESINWNHCISFRDILRKNSRIAEEYLSLKESLAEKYPDSREKYTDGKSKFISDILNRYEKEDAT